MLGTRSTGAFFRTVTTGALTVAALAQRAGAQDRLKTMPGYEQYQRVGTQIPGSVTLARVIPTWSADGKTFDYALGDQWYRFDLASKKPSEIPAPAGAERGFGRGGRGGRGGQGGPARGRQFDMLISPDSTHRALYRDRNFYVGDANGANEVAVTSDGSVPSRVKYGTASWVYGEELGQRTAFWWNPSGNKVGYYRFDESGVPDFFLETDQTHLQSTMDVEAYPKPGVPNPVVDLFVYDLATRRSVRIDVRDGKPFADSVVGYYAYHVAWSPDGSELTLYRKNRRQNVLEFAACSPETGKCRVVLREDWPTGWLENAPTMEYLKDGKRFIWESARTGFANYYLYDLSGKLITPLTRGAFEVQSIVKVDEPAAALYYMARDGGNFMKLQLHRVKLDGTGDVRLTDTAFTHSVSVSPDGKYFVDVAETHDAPPVATLRDARGRTVTPLATSDLTKYSALGLKRVEMFTFTAADGKTLLHGMLHFPSTFDPARKYPMLVQVYGGPASASNTSRETFTLPNPFTEYGFLVLNVDSRAAPGMGKRTLDAIYLKLGNVEMDDMAEGVRALWSRPYVDKARVGIYGTSYGGYTSAMEIVRHPDVFTAAAASSPPTDWRNYDTIYTERYMWLPTDNKAGYDAGSAMTYADSLRGRLLIYYGTADNNVHPNNAMQLISALQKAGKSFEVQVGPDQGHSGVNPQRMMEFFIENLVMKPATAVVP